VLTSVDLDDEALLEADEVENVAFERNLPSKLVGGQSTIPEQAPHGGFCIRRFVPHVLRELAETLRDGPMGWLLRH
jgi:hypothetical protein